MRSGYRLAGWMTARMVIGDIIYLAAALAGLACIAETFTTLLIVIKWAGVAYLSWLAVQFWRANPTTKRPERVHVRHSHHAGQSKVRPIYVSILPTVIDVSTVNMADALLLLAVT